jgi:solute:Na+ symporter, SSS family
MGALHAIDYAVLGGYLLVVVIIGWRVSRRAPEAEELFLAGRSLGWGVVGLSLFASNISSTTLIGLPGAAWQHGISVANYEWMAGLVLIFSAFFILPRLLRARVTTIPQWLEQRFDARLRQYLSGVSVLLSVALDTAGSLYAGALVLMLFIPGLDLAMTCAAMAVFAGLYTAAGGLRAVVYTDVLQTVVLLVGSTLLCGLVLAEFDFSWPQISGALSEDRLSLIRPLEDPALPWLGTLIGLPVLGFYYWTMNQYVSQRLLAARDVPTATKGALLAAALKLLPLFLMVLPGALAAALFTDLERADTVFPRLIAEYAPVGLAGLILAGLMAAIMSSVDSALNSASTLITVDFVQPRRPGLSATAMARLGRVITLGLMVFAAVWAPMIDRFPGLFDYLQQGFAYVTPQLVAVFLLGRFWPALGAVAAFRAVLSGHALSLAGFVATQLGWLNLHFSIVAGLLLGLTLVAAAAWQAILPAAAAAIPESDPPQSLRLRLIGLGILLLTAAVVGAFW